MSSFYGNGGTNNNGSASTAEIKTLIKKHISISSTQPIDQEQGDYWFVIKIAPNTNENGG